MATRRRVGASARAAWLAVFALPAALAASCGDTGSTPAEAAGGVVELGGAGESSSPSGQAGSELSDRAGGAGGSAGSSGSAGANLGGSAAAEDSSGGSAGERVVVSPGHDTCSFPAAAALPNAALPPGFCAWVWSDALAAPRGIKTDDAGNVLVVSGTQGMLTALWDDDGDGVSGPSERLILANGLGLNHGIELRGGYLYASSASQIYRWPYLEPRTVLGAPEVVVNDIPVTGHLTRTLLADAQYLYVSVGSGTNIDPDSRRARVVRFELASFTGTPRSFASGEVFADGIRNTVGLGFDARGRLWGVDNGPDGMARTDLGDVHEDNPGEELNLFEQPGSFYGYPYCWSEFLLPPGQALGPGTQWASPPFSDDGMHTDAWCRSPIHVLRPALVLQAHSAPLDILFYAGKSFPGPFVGGAFITLHGSWDRTVPTGYRVVYVAMGKEGLPSAPPVPVLSSAGPGESWQYRPVGMTTLPNGVLLISNDLGSVLALGYKPPVTAH